MPSPEPESPGITFDRQYYQCLPKRQVPCACCGSDAHVLAFEGDRHGVGLRTVVCQACGLIFTNPRPDDRWFDEFYRVHYRRVYEGVRKPSERYLRHDWIVGRHGRNLAMLAPFLGERGRVLDVGAAEGTFLHMFRQQRPGWLVEGLEPSEDFSTFARNHYGLPAVRCAPVAAILSHSDPEGFDLVAASHVLEHLLDPNALFVAARRLLKPGGHLFLDVPDAEGGKHGIWNVHIAHVYHFALGSLTNLLVKHGFEVRASRKGLEKPEAWTLQVVARRLPAPPQSWRPPAVDAPRLARRFERHASTRLSDRAVAFGRTVRHRLSRLLRAGHRPG